MCVRNIQEQPSNKSISQRRLRHRLLTNMLESQIAAQEVPPVNPISQGPYKCTTEVPPVNPISQGPYKCTTEVPPVNPISQGPYKCTTEVPPVNQISQGPYTCTDCDTDFSLICLKSDCSTRSSTGHPNQPRPV